MLLAVACFAFWWFFPWGAATDDLQMKLVVFAGGCVFVWVAVGSILTGRRFSRRGQSLTITGDGGAVILKTRDSVELIPVSSLKGVQILMRGGTAQLNLVYATGNGLERRWIHTDLKWHIEQLAGSLCRACGVEVVSRSKAPPQTS
ncbi:MAG: hypothetical protein H0T47_11680 [Planctomycetaceae bacterium]|nr:hypothetical protein [Planctomycetaceae bacterium]